MAELRPQLPNNHNARRSGAKYLLPRGRVHKGPTVSNTTVFGKLTATSAALLDHPLWTWMGVAAAGLAAIYILEGYTANARPAPAVELSPDIAVTSVAVQEFDSIRLCQGCSCGRAGGCELCGGRQGGNQGLGQCNTCPPLPNCPGGCERPLTGVDCRERPDCGELGWSAEHLLPEFNMYGQGEYIGPSRNNYPGEYRLRPDDEIAFVFRKTQVETNRPYALQVGDRIKIESLTDTTLDREVEILPDGMIYLKLMGQVRATRKTVPQLQAEIEDKYKKFYKIPAITITPTTTNTRLTQLLEAVNNRFSTGGQQRLVKVTPDGVIRLPALPCGIMAQGLTLNELQCELNQRFAQEVDGLEITAVLNQKAGNFIYVGGEVKTPNRFEISRPTNVMMALALAGNVNNGGNLREVVVFRRTDDWCLMATKLDVQGALLGKTPCPADDIWLRDSDVVIVPKAPIRRITDAIDLVFTKGIYSVMPPQFLFVAQTQFRTAP